MECSLFLSLTLPISLEELLWLWLEQKIHYEVLTAFTMLTTNVKDAVKTDTSNDCLDCLDCLLDIEQG